MRLFLDCLPCMLRQVLEAAAMATDEEMIQAQIMDEAMELLSKYRAYSCAPKLCGAMHSVVKRRTGIEDPYTKIKARDIAAALQLEPALHRFVAGKRDPLHGALKVAATGNVLDSALLKDLDIKACLSGELEKPFAVCDIEDFAQDLSKGKQILIIGDNAGEVVFDKILAQQLSHDHQVVYAVRDSAIINDATLEEARRAGMPAYAQVVSTGCGLPGAVLEACSESFKELFSQADIVISKGQGNYEALSEPPRDVYFLLKAKCPRIAGALDVDLNAYVFKKCP